MSQRIEQFVLNHKLLSGMLIALMLLLGSFVSLLIGANADITTNIFYAALFVVAGTLIYGFVTFYTSDARMEQEITSFHGRNFINTFFRIYFPVVILSVIVTVILSFALIPAQEGGWGALDRTEVSPSGMIIYVVPAILTSLGIIALSDYDMKRKNLKYSDISKQPTILRSVFYGLPLLGIYFGLTFFTRFFIEQIYGIGALIPSFSNVYEVDAGVIRAARFWLFLTDLERQLVLLGFFLVYISTEVLLRGLIGRESEGYGLRAGGLVFVPAIIQASAFSNGMLVFSDPIYYFYKFFDTLLLGIVLGILLWRTGSFSSVLVIALLAHILNSQEEFQSVILQMLPTSFGEYNPLDNTQTITDTIGVYLIYFQIALVVISPFIIIVSYEEVGRILKSLWRDLKGQWFGYLVVIIAFFLIDLVFSYFSTTQIFGPFIGFFIALIVIGFVLNFFFKVLPDPNIDEIELRTKQELFEGELPLDTKSDIQFIEREDRIYEYPYRMAAITSGFFIYFLFISAAYRQLNPLEGLDIAKFVIFLIVLPTALIGFTGYFFSRSLREGYFFSEKWRNSLYLYLGILFLINIYIWTQASATVLFQWRNVPFFVPFVLLLWPKPVDKVERDFAVGLAGTGRYATIKWAKGHPDQFTEIFDEIHDLPSDNIQSGAYIINSMLGGVEEWDLINLLRSADLERGQKIGAILGLGILKSSSAEGLLLDMLDTDDNEVKLAAFWSLGKVGSTRALTKMAKVLEENPKKMLVDIAERAILNIDPNYPLAGIRDSILVSAK